MSKILITAFEPFGFFRKLQGKNASKEILEKFQVSLDSNKYEFKILKVSLKGVQEFQDQLNNTDPSAVLSMGELFWYSNKVFVEPYAHNITVSPLPVSLLSVLTKIKHLSLSAEIEHEDNPYLTDEEAKRSHIGAYYCNRVYFEGLNWSKSFEKKRPCIFLHIPVLGDRNYQTEQVKTYLERIEKELEKEVPPNG